MYEYKIRVVSSSNILIIPVGKAIKAVLQLLVNHHQTYDLRIMFHCYAP